MRADTSVIFLRAKGFYGRYNGTKKQDFLHEISPMNFAAYYDAWSAGRGKGETRSCGSFLEEFKDKCDKAIPFIERAGAPQSGARWASLNPLWYVLAGVATTLMYVAVFRGLSV